MKDQILSLNHEELGVIWADTANIVIIQDLDGVCMGLVKDPLTRQIDVEYVKATTAFEGHFYVLTNGEHIGTRGVNGIVEKAFNGDRPFIQKEGYYLPGLAGGGVQWQDRYGNVSNPGVSEAELSFLNQVPQWMKERLNEFFASQEQLFTPEELATYIDASVLDNQVSPTINLNTIYAQIQDKTEIYLALQKSMLTLMDELQIKAKSVGLENSFFVHLAPNLGRDSEGQEIIKPAQPGDSGTTDFQYMIQGAIKEAGVIAILNRYYYQQTGTYPLGKDFNARMAPKDHQQLLSLVKDNFNPEFMPIMIGVGDTVTSSVIEENGQLEAKRGGSDRNFLQLIQDIGAQFNQSNVIVYIDSSQGEVKNRKPLKIENNQVIEGPGDPRDTSDPLRLNVVFPGGYQQYCQFFIDSASRRR